MQVEIWQKYIAWERSNPLRIEDHNLLNKRVMFGFEQCLLCLGHFPNIWYTAASHLQECARILAEKGVKKTKYSQCSKVHKKSATKIREITYRKKKSAKKSNLTRQRTVCLKSTFFEIFSNDGTAL